MLITRTVKQYPLAAILISALLIRVVLAIAVQHRLDQEPDRSFVIEGDANGYWELAVRISQGDEYSVHQPPRRILRMPGLPLLLAGVIRVFGESFLAARCLMAAAGVLACWLVFLLARELFDRRVALCASALCAFSPVMAGFSVMLLTETLFAALMLLSLLLFVRLTRIQDLSREDAKLRRTDSIRLAIGAGLAIAATSYARPVWLLAGLAFAGVSLILCRNRRVVVLHGIVMHATVAVSLLPWIVRNYHASDGHFVPTTLWVGPSLYDGLNPHATGDSNMQFIINDDLIASMSEYDVDRHYRAKAMDYAAANPGRAITLAIAKLARMWKPWPNADQFQSPLLAVLMAGWFLTVIALAVGGAVVNRSAWVLLMTIGPAVYLSSIHMLFVGSIRYRLPAEYTLAILAAAGLCHLLRGKSQAKHEALLE
ncbi:MAG: glycosyltransferase family 39 protein [Planctomycetota bacterium]|nr:glycosyltransferase family 39 protein [Planctomycetota bacterium]